MTVPAIATLRVALRQSTCTKYSEKYWSSWLSAAAVSALDSNGDQSGDYYIIHLSVFVYLVSYLQRFFGVFGTMITYWPIR